MSSTAADRFNQGSTGPLTKLTDDATFAGWLRAGLEGFLFEKLGGWAFPGAEGHFARMGYPSEALRCLYQELDSHKQGCLRRAVALVLRRIPAEERYAPVFLELLKLAPLIGASEILHELPSRLGSTFFGLLDRGHEESLFARAILTVAQLAEQGEHALGCLNALIYSKHFDHAYAGMTMISLCIAKPDGLAEHMQTMRQSLDSMFIEFRTNGRSQRRLASAMLDIINPHSMAHALPQLLYGFDRFSDRWLLDALFQNPDPLLQCRWIDPSVLAVGRPGGNDVRLSESSGKGFHHLTSCLSRLGYLPSKTITATDPRNPLAPTRHSPTGLGRYFLPVLSVAG